MQNNYETIGNYGAVQKTVDKTACRAKANGQA
jgi:hypothetical protein